MTINKLSTMLCIKFVKFVSNDLREYFCFVLDSFPTRQCQKFADRLMCDEQKLIKIVPLKLYKNII